MPPPEREHQLGHERYSAQAQADDQPNFTSAPDSRDECDTRRDGHK
jgi:hypothetical protein